MQAGSIDNTWNCSGSRQCQYLRFLHMVMLGALDEIVFNRILGIIGCVNPQLPVKFDISCSSNVTRDSCCLK